MTAVVGLLGRVPDFAEKSMPDTLVGELDVSTDVASVLKAGLQMMPDQRPKDAAVFLRQLKAARRPVPTIIVPEPSWQDPTWKEGRDDFGVYADVTIPGSKASFRMRFIQPGYVLDGVAGP